jgi:putative ABC transport system permease protein
MRCCTTPDRESPIVNSLPTWRVTLRIARRTALRHKGRSALIFAMIALPVFAGTVIAVGMHTMRITTQQQKVWSLGQADAQLFAPDKGGLAAARKAVPPGAKTVPYTDGTADLRTTAGQVPVPAVVADLDNPLLSGMYRLRSGHFPHRAGEVAVSTALARHRKLTLGGSIALTNPAHTVRIVGLVQRPQTLDSEFMVGADDSAISRGVLSRSLFVSVPVGSPEFHQMIQHSSASGYFSQLNLAGDTGRTWMDRYGMALIVVGFAATEIVLLAGSAFAVGARKQRRELGMIAAVGGDTGHVARVVLGGGIVLGLTGGVVGVALGLAVAFVDRPVLQHLSNHLLGPTVIRPTELVGIALLAAVSGVVAAAVPAHWAGRQPVLDALTGRTAHPPRSPRRVVAIGLTTAAIGGALAYLGATRPVRPELIAIGSAVGLVGFALCAPTLVAISGRLAPILPLSGRLALRDAARHRNRTGAAVAAVTAAVAGSVAISLYLASSADRSARTSVEAPAGQLSISGDSAVLSKLDTHELAELGKVVHARSVAPINGLSGLSANSARLTVGDAFGDEVAVGGAAVIRLVTGQDPPATALETLRRGGIVVFQRRLLDGDGVVVRRHTNDADRHITLPAAVVPAAHEYSGLPAAVIDSTTATWLRARPYLQRIVLDTPEAPSPAELERVNKLLADDASDSGDLSVSVAQPPDQQDRVTILLLAAASAFVTLAATGIAVGLSAAESRDDAILLAAIGAAPRVRRVLSGAQAGLISVLGTVLGIPAGLIPAAGVISTHSDSMRFVVPWGPMAIGCLVAPVLVVLLSGACTRPRLPMPRRLT